MGVGMWGGGGAPRPGRPGSSVWVWACGEGGVLLVWAAQEVLYGCGHVGRGGAPRPGRPGSNVRVWARVRGECSSPKAARSGAARQIWSRPSPMSHGPALVGGSYCADTIA